MVVSSQKVIKMVVSQPAHDQDGDCKPARNQTSEILPARYQTEIFAHDEACDQVGILCSYWSQDVTRMVFLAHNADGTWSGGCSFLVMEPFLDHDGAST
jgi:hypothetical protein